MSLARSDQFVQYRARRNYEICVRLVRTISKNSLLIVACGGIMGYEGNFIARDDGIAEAGEGPSAAGYCCADLCLVAD